jgi:hypothetical protein
VPRAPALRVGRWPLRARRSRALAVPLGANTSSSAVAAAPRRRVWHTAGRAAVPPEPGRLQTNALVNVARAVRGCRTRGDDRLETRAYAVKRLLWRWGHAERSGHYARSIWQLVDGLAPIMGWGPVPARDDPRRQRWLRAHAANVRRWLADLQAAGIISYTGETDNLGMDWRTLITLNHAPAPPSEQMEAARSRMASWARRRRSAARRHRSDRRRRGRRLEAIRHSSHPPSAAARRRLAIARCLAAHDRRRVAAVERQLADSGRRKLRTHHLGSSDFVGAPKALSTSASGNHDLCRDRTGVTRARASASTGAWSADRGTKTASLTVVRSNAPGERAGWDESALLGRVAARLAARQPVLEIIAAQATSRALDVVWWTLARGWPSWRLQEAWVLWRHGATYVAEWGAAAAGPLEHGDLERLRRAVTRIERHAAARPTGFPAGGLATLAHIAAVAAERDSKPLTLHYAIRALDQLSRRMRGCATAADPRRLQHMADRARRRQLPSSEPALRFAWRTTAAPRWPRWVALDDHGDPLLVNGELVTRDEFVPRPGYEHQPWVAPRRTDPCYLEVLRTAHLLAGLWPPVHTDGRAIVASRSDHDPSDERPRARPEGPPPPADRRAHADPADLELTQHTGIALRDAQRIDIDLRDSILAARRAEQRERDAQAREALWARLAVIHDRSGCVSASSADHPTPRAAAQRATEPRRKPATQ